MDILWFNLGTLLGVVLGAGLVLGLAYRPAPRRPKNPLSDYEIRSVDTVGDAAGGYIKITPYYRGRPISEGKYPGIYGYATAIRTAKRAIHVHRRNHVDPNRAKR